MHWQKINGDYRYISAELWTDKELAIIETNETIMCSRKTVSTHFAKGKLYLTEVLYYEHTHKRQT